MSQQMPAGWYTDPASAAQFRYWDGAQWTEHVAARPEVGAANPTHALPPQATTPPTSSYPQSQPQSAKKGLSTGAIVGIVAGVVVLVLIVVAVLAAMAIPVFRSQQSKAEDSAARADVSTLGKEIATYYVDHQGPVPDITVQDGLYVIEGDGTTIAVAKSDGVRLGGVTGTSGTNWCVWVTAPAGEVKDARFTAQGGLADGRC